MAAAAAALTATAQVAEATVVLDIGSLTTKAGFAASIPSDDEPRVVTPSRVHVLPTGVAGGGGGANGNSGLTAQQLQQYPFRRAFDGGRLADADALESVLHYVLYELVGWQPGREGPLVLVEPGGGLPRRDREALVQLLFEVFSVTHLYSVDALAASAYAHGRLTSTVLDLGHGRADVGAVVDGTTQLASAARLPEGRSGAALDAALRGLLERAARGDGGGGKGPAPMALGGGGEGSPSSPLSGADAVAAATDERVRALKERCSRAKASAAEFDERCGFFGAGPGAGAEAVGARREWWRASSVVLTPPPPGFAEEQERRRREAEETEAEAARKKEREEEEAAARAKANRDKEGGGGGAGGGGSGGKEQQPPPGKQKKKKETAEDVDDEPPDVLDPLEPHIYTLPDGASITVEPRLGAALGESLFRPRALAEVLSAPAVALGGAWATSAALGADGAGTLAEAVVAVAAQHPDPSTRRALLESILPVGGVAVTPGLAGRLEAEVRTRGAPLPSARVACPPPPPYWGARSRALRFAPWLGGAVLARVLPGQNRLVHKGDYEEGGPAAVARKFLG